MTSSMCRDAGWGFEDCSSEFSRGAPVCHLCWAVVIDRQCNGATLRTCHAGERRSRRKGRARTPPASAKSLPRQTPRAACPHEGLHTSYRQLPGLTKLQSSRTSPRNRGTYTRRAASLPPSLKYSETRQGFQSSRSRVPQAAAGRLVGRRIFSGSDRGSKWKIA